MVRIVRSSHAAQALSYETPRPFRGIPSNRRVMAAQDHAVRYSEPLVSLDFPHLARSRQLQIHPNLRKTLRQSNADRAVHPQLPA
jgi:hypothetical protein